MAGNDNITERLPESASDICELANQLTDEQIVKYLGSMLPDWGDELNTSVVFVRYFRNPDQEDRLTWYRVRSEAIRFCRALAAERKAGYLDAIEYISDLSIALKYMAMMDVDIESEGESGVIKES